MYALADSKRTTVKKLLEDLGPGELQHWQAFYSLNPMPDGWDSWAQTARLCHVTVASRGGKVKAQDFMPKYDRVASTPDEIRALLMPYARRKPKVE